MPDLRQQHWDQAYTAKGDRVSWWQDRPELSLRLIGPAAGRSLVDIGGGASRLVDALLPDWPDITVLDISGVALERAKERLGVAAARVNWVVADITRWQPQRTWDVWHDRAVFHFLTKPADQEAYLAALRAGTRPGATIIMATFALTGPEKCSDLPVQRYSAASLAARLGQSFALRAAMADPHRTPWDAIQDFTWTRFERV